MTRTLYLLRHAKSGWDSPAQPDFDRTLNPRGRAEAAELAGLADALGYAPEIILCSTARRTRETLAGLLSGLRNEAELLLTRQIYEAEWTTLLALIQALPAQAQSAMLIGHNPGMEELARRLSGSGDERARHALAAKYPPAGLAIISLEAAWEAATPGAGRLEAFHTPREA